MVIISFNKEKTLIHVWFHSGRKIWRSLMRDSRANSFLMWKTAFSLRLPLSLTCSVTFIFHLLFTMHGAINAPKVCILNQLLSACFGARHPWMRECDFYQRRLYCFNQTLANVNGIGVNHLSASVLMENNPSILSLALTFFFWKIVQDCSMPVFSSNIGLLIFHKDTKIKERIRKNIV